MIAGVIGARSPRGRSSSTASRVSSAFPGGAGVELRAAGGSGPLTIPPDSGLPRPAGLRLFLLRPRDQQRRRHGGSRSRRRLPDSVEDIALAPQPDSACSRARDFRSWYVPRWCSGRTDASRVPVRARPRAPTNRSSAPTRCPARPQHMARWLDALVGARRILGALPETIGTLRSEPPDSSRHGDRYGRSRRPQKDRVLITSGFHPAEADWLATVGADRRADIARRLGAGDPPPVHSSTSCRR